MNLKFLRTTLCLAAVAMSAWALPASAASAKGKVSIFLVGERVAGGKKISVDSETRKIKPSKQYTYKLTGTVRGAAKSTLSKLLPNPVSIDKFVEAIAPGGSKFLTGTVDNPDGTLPFTLLTKKYSGSIKAGSLGKVKVSFILTAQLLADGTSQLELTKVRISNATNSRLGSLVFLKGSAFSVSAAPVVEFKGSNVFISENENSVSINIFRTQNTAGPASVEFETIDGTADSSHYTPTSGRIEFSDREVKKTITIPIVDNTVQDGKRIFTVQLKNPGDGALLGTRFIMKVNIKDDE